MDEFAVAYHAPTTDDTPGQVRRWIAAILKGHGEDTFTEDAVILASEIVSNVLVHTTSSGTEVLLTYDPPVLRVEVVDDDPSTRPMLRTDASPAVGGMGLHIVDQVAHRWGTSVDEHEKRVWFELLAPPGHGHDHPIAGED